MLPPTGGGRVDFTGSDAMGTTAGATAEARQDRRWQVVVCGQGYVGLPVAVQAARAGHAVVGYDVDPDRVKRLACGESYVEDVPSAVLREVLADGSYRPSDEVRSCAGFEVAVITVPTPL